jgi:molybdopterin molybdotransferase
MPVISTIDVPPYTNSAMDGYALCGADLPASGNARLKLIGRAMAGAPFAGRVGIRRSSAHHDRRGHARGCRHRADAGAGRRRRRLDRGRQRPQTGENVRKAGEDMAAGDTVLAPGKLLLPAEIGVLASLGIAEVRVKRRLRVAFFSTGDELRSLGEPLGRDRSTTATAIPCTAC